MGPAYVNARNERGELIKHYAVGADVALEDPRYCGLATFYPLNTAVHLGARRDGRAGGARALFRHLATLRPSLVLGVANEQSYAGFTRLLGFHSLGRLALRVLAPWSLPGPTPARAVSIDDAYLRWRAARPGAHMYVQPSRGAVLRRIRHAGLPVDVVLAVGLSSSAVERLASAHPRNAPWPPAPRLYATFGTIKPAGLEVPERLRPSPLQYIVLPLDKALDRTELAAHLATRRFEFLDFDVV